VRPGATARDQILDAAAELFTSQGFANTSTRAIADAVGIRQSSLYHHFATKDDILGELLKGTVMPSLDFARAVWADAEPSGTEVTDSVEGGEAGELLAAAARLHAVVLYDGTQLCDARWNLGVLYHLPEARAERFEHFLSDRRELRQLYRGLGRKVEILAGRTALAGTGRIGDLAFRLVESLINVRADGLLEPDSAQQTADSSIALAGLTEQLPAIRTSSAQLARQSPAAARPW
jgi:AcrR family transcriptional regulator